MYDYVRPIVGPECDSIFTTGRCPHESCHRALMMPMRWWSPKQDHVGTAVEHSIQDPFTGAISVKVHICDHNPGEPCPGHA